MERFTFDEIKNFKDGDVFWAYDGKHTVVDAPSYFSESNFYGDFSEKVEWSALSSKTNRTSKFQVTNIRSDESQNDPIVFKVPTREEKIEGKESEIILGSNIIK